MLGLWTASSPWPTQGWAKDRTELPKQEAAEIHAVHWIRAVALASTSAKKSWFIVTGTSDGAVADIPPPG